MTRQQYSQYKKNTKNCIGYIAALFWWAGDIRLSTRRSAAVRWPGEHKALAGPAGRWCQGEDLYCRHQSPRNLPAITFPSQADTKPARGFKRWGQRRPCWGAEKTPRATDGSGLFVHLLQLSLINQLIWQFPTFFCI